MNALFTKTLESTSFSDDQSLILSDTRILEASNLVTEFPNDFTPKFAIIKIWSSITRALHWT